jgi:hypothetical protein
MMSDLSLSSSRRSSSVDQQEHKEEKVSRSIVTPASSSSADDTSIVSDSNEKDGNRKEQLSNAFVGNGTCTCMVDPDTGKNTKKDDTRSSSVTFSSVCTMRRTIHINDYTPEELHACFWQVDELAVINERNAHMIVYMELLEEGLQQQNQEQKHEQQHQGQQPYTRGLEHHTSRARRHRVMARQCQYEAVMVVEELMMTKTRLDAVEVGVGEEVDDDSYYANLLAEACRHISFSCSEEAVRRARFDEWQATALVI